MPPFTALSISIILILCLFVFDCRNSPGVTKSIWIPLIWMIISGSRLVSQWIQFKTIGIDSSAILEGNPIDRITFLILIFIGIVILSKRHINLKNIFRQNLWLSVFFIYCFLSICWSDYSFVSFKRYIKEFGNVVMVLIILTEADKIEAIRALNRRFAYFMISMSIVFNKYFPHLAKEYDYWTGTGQFIGVTTSKNMLGNVCMICGLFFIWDLLIIKKHREFVIQKKQVIINIGFLILIFLLLMQSHSATSLGTLVIGTALLLAGSLKSIRKHAGSLGAVLFIIFCVFGVLYFTSDILNVFTEALGRDSTFTTRTYIWKELLNIKIDPILGAGFESFWLGTRLKALWTFDYMKGLNQAHNGYLETYLNLGYVGLTFLVLIIVSTYKRICSILTDQFDFGIYRLTFFIVILLYNVTEAAFKGVYLVWFVFLLVSINVDNRSWNRSWIRVKENSLLNTKLKAGPLS